MPPYWLKTICTGGEVVVSMYRAAVCLTSGWTSLASGAHVGAAAEEWGDAAGDVGKGPAVEVATPLWPCVVGVVVVSVGAASADPEPSASESGDWRPVED